MQLGTAFPEPVRYKNSLSDMHPPLQLCPSLRSSCTTAHLWHNCADRVHPCTLQANWDLYRAAKMGFSALADEARAVPDVPAFMSYRTSWAVRFTYRGHLRNLPGSLGWSFWEGFMRDPLKPTVAQLKQAYEMVDMTVCLAA